MSCAPFSEPPTPAKNEPLVMASFRAFSPLKVPDVIGTVVSVKVPAATTKPEPMSIPSVPPTEKVSPVYEIGVVPTVTVGVKCVQSSAAASMFAPVGSKKPLPRLMSIEMFEPYTLRPSMPLREALKPEAVSACQLRWSPAA